ncbi:unnamed protein product [Acanthoscelides obtectus]|uniref:Uncharacterized protein n=1 Tax=Acanthoscelides obtectus TaxID=200917 RepID=A0A9P0PAP2_ACAOB|nr:unnamed protein product [Acanthoscelides obtectus]CAK1681652.1 hypothetical protein AOBTE_LOCUS33191 [Acanthoscelides obtectus]
MTTTIFEKTCASNGPGKQDYNLHVCCT